MMRILDVYLNKDFVGLLSQDDAGELTFSYAAEYLQAGGRKISLLFPVGGLTHTWTGVAVKAFFAGLLPEESVRQRLAGYLGLSEKNVFSLLEAVGGECAGALALYPHGEKPAPATYEAETLDTLRLKEILELIKRRPMLAGDGGYRLSLAGAQDKLAVGFKNNQVLLMKGGAPTTHILKPMIERVKDSAHNELFCMKLAHKMGIEVPHASLHYVDDTPYYLVERYDRVMDNHGGVTRLHQEDFCQAMGISPEIKYQAEGGPDIGQCQSLISQNVAKPAVDQIKFLNRIIFNYLIGNADAHGKNFSLLYLGDKPELAPAYDLLSTAVYLDLSEKMAMKIGGEYKPRNIYRHNFFRLVPETKAAQTSINKQITVMTDKIYDAAVTLKSDLEQEGLCSEIFETILGVIKVRVQKLSAKV
jgi:serine/threonine-protein kinase HipA